MSANLHRRGLLGLFAAAPVAAAAGVPPASALDRARYLVRSGRASPFAASTMGRIEGMTRGLGIADVGPALERANPLTQDLPAEMSALVARMETDAAEEPDELAAQARAIAALAPAFPPEIAAFRSFGAPMKRRLYAELLARHGAPRPITLPADSGQPRAPASKRARHPSRGHR